jgi:hypothetical protein
MGSGHTMLLFLWNVVFYHVHTEHVISIDSAGL